MRRLYTSGLLCSLTYRNMPFVLAPNLWGRMAPTRKTANTPIMRAHGDRILVDIDSPESLDEVFWRVFDASSYIGDTYLRPHAPSAEIANKYIDYVSAILNADRYKRARYLSKNNNNILRLETINLCFPNAIILIPFRDPVAHANSLLRQHQNFMKQQQESSFVQSYMTWLGHHEFGRDHRPFRFDELGRKRLAMHKPDSLAYWLEIWLQTYEWLEKTAPSNALFICYEDLCNIPTTWQRLADICNIPADSKQNEPFFAVNTETKNTTNERLVEQTNALYQRLVDQSRSALQMRSP